MTKLSRLGLFLASLAACATAPERDVSWRAQEVTGAKVTQAVTVSSSSAIDPAIVMHETRPEVRPQGSTSMAVGFDGTNYLVAWYEVRGGYHRIMASRVSEAGVRLSTIVVASEERGPRTDFGDVGYDQGPIRVTGGNGGSLITWTDLGYGSRKIRGVRVLNNGTVVDAAPLVVGEGTISYAAASDGTDFVVVSSALTGSYTPMLRATVVRGVLQSAPAVGGTFDVGRGRVYEQPILVNAGAGFLLMWPESGSGGFETYKAARFEANGTILEPVHAVTNLGSAFVNGTAAVRGSDILFLSGYDPEVSYVLDATGAVKSGPTPMPADTQGLVSLSSGANGYVGAFNSVQYPSKCLQWFSITGATVGPCVPIGSVTEEDAQIAFGSTTSLFVTPKRNYWEPDSQAIIAHVVASPAGTSVADVPVSYAANAQGASAIGFDGEKYLVAWVDDRDLDQPLSGTGRVAIYATRVSVDGVAEPAVRLSSPGLVWASRPAIVFDGSFFVAWHEQTATAEQVIGMEIAASQAGPLAPSQELVITSDPLGGTPSSDQPAVASDGQTRLAVWSTGEGRVYAARVSRASGAVVTPATPLGYVYVPYNGRPQGLAAVFDGTQFLVAWAAGQIEACAFAKDAPSLACTPFLLVTTSVWEAPALATDGVSGSLLVWGEFSYADDMIDVRGKFIPSSHPELVKPTEGILDIGVALGEQSFPAVTYSKDDVGYMVAWNDFRDPAARRIYGNWVATDGRVLAGSSGQLIGEAAVDDEESPALTTSGKARVGMVYSRFERASGVANARLRFRTVSTGRLNGDACSTTTDCASRYCVSGVCCNEPCNEECASCTLTPGTCGARARTEACGPDKAYVCDGTTRLCSGSCEADDQCAAGKVCVEHACVAPRVVQPYCLDAATLRAPSGDQSCAPYRCREGACLEICQSVDDCSDGQVCNFDGRCVVATDPEQSSGCSFKGRRSEYPGVAGISMVAMMLLARRRVCRKRL